MTETVDSPTFIVEPAAIPSKAVVSGDSSRVAFLEKEIMVLKTCLNKLLNQNNSSEKTNKLLTEDVKKLHDRMYNNEFRLYELCQYSRRENIELHNIPETIHQNQPEDHVIIVLGSIGMKSYQIKTGR